MNNEDINNAVEVIAKANYERGYKKAKADRKEHIKKLINEIN